jgi:hypothetical protein
MSSRTKHQEKTKKSLRDKYSLTKDKYLLRWNKYSLSTSKYSVKEIHVHQAITKRENKYSMKGNKNLWRTNIHRRQTNM